MNGWRQASKRHNSLTINHYEYLGLWYMPDFFVGICIWADFFALTILI